MTVQTRTHVLVDLNVGEHSPDVLHDLQAITAERPTIVALQGMSRLDQWAYLHRVFPARDWQRYPWHWAKRGAAQVILWDRDVWAPVTKRELPGMGIDPRLTILLHDGESRVTGSRYLNAVLLRDRHTGLCCWFTNRHYIPGSEGQMPYDAPNLRKFLWRQGNQRDRDVITRLSQTGYPVVSVGDFSSLGTNPMGYLVNGHRVEYVGQRGTDFVILVPGADDNNTASVQQSTRTRDGLRTPHPMRVVDFNLVGMSGKVAKPALQVVAS